MTEPSGPDAQSVNESNLLKMADAKHGPHLPALHFCAAVPNHRKTSLFPLYSSMASGLGPRIATARLTRCGYPHIRKMGATGMVRSLFVAVLVLSCMGTVPAYTADTPLVI